jgi:BCD family chlorophyll transporter-like MFS transporter
MASHVALGIALAVFAFCLIGAGVGAAGTSLLVLLAKRTDDRRRAAAATIVWVMMIAGFIVTTATAGHLLDPFSPSRLVMVSGAVSVIAMTLTLIGVWGVEPAMPETMVVSPGQKPSASFSGALRDVWREPQARRFALFVFVSMLAYSAQDLILEPFAGVVFGFSPGETTKLSSIQHIGTLIGMAMVPLIGVLFPASRGNLKTWTIIGCLTSALALLALAAASMSGAKWPLRETVFALGIANGAYAVAAIGSMMALVSAGTSQREGVRMGLWGAAQAFAFGLGGFLGTLATDAAHAVLVVPARAYAVVFVAEAGLFMVAAAMAVWVHRAGVRRRADAGVLDLAQGAMAGGVR